MKRCQSAERPRELQTEEMVEAIHDPWRGQCLGELRDVFWRILQLPEGRVEFARGHSVSNFGRLDSDDAV